MSISEQAQQVLDGMLKNDMKAVFDNPTTFAQVYQSCREEQAKPFEFTSTALKYSTATKQLLADGSQYYVLDPITENTDEDQLTIVYFHGGGFILQIADVDWEFADSLVKALNCRVLVSVYPLAPTSNYKLTYSHAIELYKIALESSKPQNLIVMGESAGGCIAAAVGHLALQQQLPQPALIALISPIVDYNANPTPEEEAKANDPLIGSYGLVELLKDWIPDANDWNKFPANPIEGPFDGLAPLWINIGTREILFRPAINYANKAIQANVDTQLVIGQDLWHTYILMPGMPEQEAAFESLLEAIQNKAAR